ncbi:MFS transporter [Candidatus Tisiphia endosymbiont of Piscicola geometra]|uniref:MFS transporter n=1 Tax=Candidatus Tisiphia endosymbiont of Piscicola geometra TaxID=3066273 RepID=UPI00312CB0F4
MIGSQKEQRSLTKGQKEAVGLLSIGTFLEYFDLFLYVHMAVLLNELFFPKYDPHTTTLLSSLAFCSIFVFRPIGALIFGWIGDNIGRKTTVIITTFMMSGSCLVMAKLSTYEQIGISASCIVTVCRIVQGMSSMGEQIGAELYLSELIKPPFRNVAVGIVGIFASIGIMVALGIASLVTSYGFNWRLAFWFGAGIALIGAVARTNLRETPDFADAKRRIKVVAEQSNIDPKKLADNTAWQEKINKKTAVAYFILGSAWPAWLYLGYIYCGNILKNSFHFTAEQVIYQNFIVSIVDLAAAVILVYLVRKNHPLKILKVKLIIFTPFVILFPIVLNNLTSPFELLVVQCFIVLFAPVDFPARAILYMYFPVFKRFTASIFLAALSKAAMYVTTAFGFVYLKNILVIGAY